MDDSVPDGPGCLVLAEHNLFASSPGDAVRPLKRAVAPIARLYRAAMVELCQLVDGHAPDRESWNGRQEPKRGSARRSFVHLPCAQARTYGGSASTTRTTAVRSNASSLT